MAPELFERQPGERVAYSESSDVYSLGILINEIMSGTMPWGGGAREVDIMNWVAPVITDRSIFLSDKGIQLAPF